MIIEKVIKMMLKELTEMNVALLECGEGIRKELSRLNDNIEKAVK